VNYLSEEEIAAYCSIIYRRTLTAIMLAEVEITQANARQVAADGIPAVPLYFFISNGDGLPMDNWGETLAAYAASAGGESLTLEVGHYVHSEAPDLVAAETRAFLQRLR
jgi:pimeloyl-ACP methyl ester carboxylesterase